MKAHEAFPSNYLKAADLNGKRPIVTITHVTTEDLGGDSKRAAHFKGTDKILILNRTNWNTIAEIAGKDDDDDWTGVQICLYATKVDFQGQRKDAIRVDYPKGNAATLPPSRPVPVEMPKADQIFGGADRDDDDPIPF